MNDCYLGVTLMTDKRVVLLLIVIFVAKAKKLIYK